MVLHVTSLPASSSPEDEEGSLTTFYDIRWGILTKKHSLTISGVFFFLSTCSNMYDNVQRYVLGLVCFIDRKGTSQRVLLLLPFSD